jgi:hypothetical protein
MTLSSLKAKAYFTVTVHSVTVDDSNSYLFFVFVVVQASVITEFTNRPVTDVT